MSLGKYAEVVAALVAVGIIGAAVASRLVPGGTSDAFLDSLAFAAFGAIFGSTATANGVKAGQVVIERKLDHAADVAAEKAVAKANGNPLG